MIKTIQQFKIRFLNKPNGIYLVMFLISFVIAEIGREIYRPYIYENNIDDFGFADTIGNTFGTIAIIFFIFAIVMQKNFRKEIYFIPALVASLILYEIYQGFIPGYYFDWKDVIATIIAGIISYLIFRLVNRNSSENTKK